MVTVATKVVVVDVTAVEVLSSTTVEVIVTDSVLVEVILPKILYAVLVTVAVTVCSNTGVATVTVFDKPSTVTIVTTLIWTSTLRMGLVQRVPLSFETKVKK